MASPTISKPLLLMVLNFCILLLHNSSVSSHQFEVGGDKGWSKPTSDNYTMIDGPYNAWAAKNRFHMGDSLHFNYQMDSVLVVGYEDYQNCTTTNPISKFDDGDTVFEFNRSGFFYFISGQPGHCKAGQKLIIRVMHHSEYHHSPESAPSPGGEHHRGRDSDNLGPSSVHNSTTRLSAVAPYFMTALASLLLIIYMFI